MRSSSATAASAPGAGRHIQQRQLSAAVAQVAHGALETFYVLEIPVNAGVAYVGHPVQVGKPLHYQGTQEEGIRFDVAAPVEFGLHFVHQLLNGLRCYRTLGTSLVQPGDHFLPAELLPASVALVDHQRRCLHPLVGCEALAAIEALAAAADASVVSPGVGYLGFSI